MLKQGLHSGLFPDVRVHWIVSQAGLDYPVRYQPAQADNEQRGNCGEEKIVEWVQGYTRFDDLGSGL
jgi:hypothetical protein